MENLFNKQGNLTVSLGKGYLTAYEVSNLKEGDVVQSSLLAGNPCPVYFNSEIFGYGEIIVAEGIYCLRMSRFVDNNNMVPFPGVVDEITEVLPFTINLMNMQFSLEQLKGITIGSFILGKEEDNKAELYVTGFPVAKGTVVIIEENFGIEVTEVYNKIEPIKKIRQSYFLVNQKFEKRSIKKYDFRRPDKFSMNSIISIAKVHDYYCRNLKMLVHELENYTVIEVDQLAYNEIFSVLQKGHNFFLFESKPVSRNYIYNEKQNVIDSRETKSIAISKDIEHKVRKDFVQEITAWINGQKKNPDKPVIISAPEKSSFANYLKELEIDEFIINPLRSAWKNYVNINFSLKKLTENIDDVKVIPDKDMIVMVKIGDEKNPEDYCIMIYPYITLEPFLDILD